jgi:L,D-peptidoglycan transpeptidase YkuD (ErfK/YbiS/YcfS/YnhG family)
VPRRLFAKSPRRLGVSSASRMVRKTRETRNGFVVLLALMVQFLAPNGTGQTADASFEPPLQLRASIPEISKCRQLIVVTTNAWNAVSATIQLFERALGGQMPWNKVGKPFSGVIGDRGFAWGIGLHGTGEAGAPRKKEGDESSPAGVFRLSSVFGLASSDQVRFLRFPYQQITATTEAIDDPRSRYYNRIVDRAIIAHPDWSSSESMLRVGGPYRCGIMIEHNWQPRPGFGSCIFLHVWNSARRGTAGCTAVSSAHLEEVLHWLDAQKNPLIVQLPLLEYLRLRQFWQLPFPGSARSNRGVPTLP